MQFSRFTESAVNELKNKLPLFRILTTKMKKAGLFHCGVFYSFTLKFP
ncbi:MAG: hypothetical protein FD166_1524 [Bacteroidetes bacterium]|nr:MAG: hypothetical protein FD166_1524 [Bacteroidota bacterium]